MKVYFDFRDWWIGYYRGDRHHYVCLFPTVVIRWNRKQKPAPILGTNLLEMPVMVRDWMPENKAYIIGGGGTSEIAQEIFAGLRPMPPQPALMIHPDTLKLVEKLLDTKWPNSPA